MAHSVCLRWFGGIKLTVAGRQSPRLPITKRLWDIIYSSLDMQTVVDQRRWQEYLTTSSKSWDVG